MADNVDGRERRRDARIFFAALFLFHAAVGVASPLLPRLRDALAASYAQVGWVNAAFGVSRLATNIPVGWLLHRRSPGLLVFAGMGAVIIGNLVAALAGTIQGVIGGRAVAGCGYSATVVGTLTLLSSLATETGRARVFSLYEFLMVASLAFTTTVTGAAAEWAGWRAGFALGAVLAALGLVAAFASLGKRRLATGRPAATDTRVIPRLAKTGGRAGARVVGLVLFVAFLLSYAWTGLFTTLFPLFGGERLSLGTGMVGMAMSAGYVADLAFLFPYGWMADRFGRIPVLLAGILLIVVAAFALPLTESDLTYIAVALLIGVGFACWALPPAVLTDWVSPGSRGMVLGIYRFMVDLGYVLGPWSVTVVLERGGFRVAAWTVAALTGAGALAFFHLRRHPAPPVPDLESEGGGPLQL